MSDAAGEIPDARAPHRPRRPYTFWRSFGPGLLWAAAAIGVSHLVQSTRAGADAGLALSGVILLALVLKYPFFEYGPRYAAATGHSLVEGYRDIGRWALWLYLALTVSTAVVVEGAIILFTAFLLRFLLGLSMSVTLTGVLLYGFCALLLRVGRFRLLDAFVKLVLLALTLSTLLAAAVALPRVDLGTFALIPRIGADGVSFAFLLALMGWMPSAIDIAVWSSLWTLAKDRQSGWRASVRTARVDFMIGYLGTGVMAFAFLILGAAVMHGTGATFDARGTAFSLQLVDLYGSTLGTWARPVVLVAVLTTMLSTSITVVDGFPRAIARTVMVMREERVDRRAVSPATDEGALYWGTMIAVGVLVAVLLARFVGTLTAMVDFATTVSFLTGPILGYLNLRAVRSDAVPEPHRPGRAMVWLSWSGIALLGGTGVLYLIGLLF